MVLQRLDRFGQLRRVEDTMERLWRGFGPRYVVRNGVEHWRVPLDVVEDGDNIVVQASIPGAKADDIEAHVEDGVLTVGAETSSEAETKDGSYLLRERRTGSYHRSIRLPGSVDADKAESSYENGVLTITFPKQDAKKAKRIEVQIK